MKNNLASFTSKCVNVYKCYATELNNITEVLELQNKVASLSNSSVANTLMQTIKQIAYVGREPNHETICKYLKQVIEDLASGMDAAYVLWKYDKILYDLKNPKLEHRGYRAKILIADDLCDGDKEELKEILKE